MKRILLASAALLLAVPAYAQQVGGDIGFGASANQQTGVNSAVSTGPIGSDSSATGGAGGAGGAGGQGGASQSRSTGGTATGSVSSTTTFSSNNPSTIRNTPSVALGLATAYCSNSGGVTGSGPGFSFGVALGKHDIDCKRLNYAILLEAMGDREAAILIVSNNEEVNRAVTESRRRRNAEVMAAAQAVAVSRPGYCREQPGESEADRLMRQRQPSCGR